MDAIHTRIGAAEDLANAQSTFMVEMTEAAAILHGATDQSLVLMDEIGRGTSTFDGLALAGAIASHLHDRNRSFTLFATHYFELTAFPLKHERALNVHVSAVESGRRGPSFGSTTAGSRHGVSSKSGTCQFGNARVSHHSMNPSCGLMRRTSET